MKVWPIDPLVPRNLRLEVPEKLPQGSARRLSLGRARAEHAKVGALRPGAASGSGDACGQSGGDWPRSAPKRSVGIASGYSVARGTVGPVGNAPARHLARGTLGGMLLQWVSQAEPEQGLYRAR